VQRVTRQTVAVLQAVAAADAPLWGLAIIESTGLPSGTVYPALARLFDAGWLSSYGDKGGHAGAPRTLYALTPEGVDGLRVAQARLAATPARSSRARPR